MMKKKMTGVTGSGVVSGIYPENMISCFENPEVRGTDSAAYEQHGKKQMNPGFRLMKAQKHI